MNNRKYRILFELLFLLGFGIFNYPTVSAWYNQMNQGAVMSVYDETVDKMDAENQELYFQNAREYNRNLNLSVQPLQDAFDGRDTEKSQGYEKILNMEESGVMGSIEIPKILAYLPIYHGTSSEILQKGIGHLQGSSLPVGGEGSHAVLTGHRGLPQAEMFSNLDQLSTDDVFYIHILKRTLAYRIYKEEVVEPAEIASLGIQAGKDIVTLVTCTPYGINSHRMLIHGIRIPYEEEPQMIQSHEVVAENNIQWLLRQKKFCISVGILLLLLLYRIIWAVCSWKKGR